MIKDISIQVKISEHTLFFRESTGCSKILNVKNIFSTANLGQLCFSGQAQSCSKLLISIQRKISGQTLFSGQAQVVKNPECKKYIQYSEKFQGKSVFSGQAQVAQKP